jgi:hypothetical protein
MCWCRSASCLNCLGQWLHCICVTYLPPALEPIALLTLVTTAALVLEVAAQVVLTRACVRLGTATAETCPPCPAPLIRLVTTLHTAAAAVGVMPLDPYNALLPCTAAGLYVEHEVTQPPVTGTGTWGAGCCAALAGGAWVWTAATCAWRACFVSKLRAQCLQGTGLQIRDMGCTALLMYGRAQSLQQPALHTGCSRAGTAAGIITLN